MGSVVTVDTIQLYFNPSLSKALILSVFFYLKQFLVLSKCQRSRSLVRFAAVSSQAALTSGTLRLLLPCSPHNLTVETERQKETMSSSKQILIYGGKGALGSALVNYFKAKDFRTISVDFVKNDDADHNVVLQPNLTLEDQAKLVSSHIPEGTSLDGIVCVAGGWAGGNVGSADFVKNCDLMLQQSVWTSCIASSLAPTFLKEQGLLVLTGAQPALKPTPGMIGYGVAKAAVHQLVKSLGCPAGGLPTGATAYGILPVTLDTPMNRKWMKHDGTWTPLEHVAEIVDGWLNKAELHPNGSLIQLITKDGKTTQVVAE